MTTHGKMLHMLSQRKIGLIALVTPVWFIVTYLVMSAMRPDYDHTDQAISELGSLDAPNLWAWNILGYILPGLAIALLGLALKREFAPRNRSALIPAMALVAVGLFMALSGVFPANMADFQSATTQIHYVGALGSYAAFAVAAFWLPAVFRKSSSWRWIAAPSLVIVIASVATGVLRFVGMASIGQRLTFTCVFLWVALVGFALWRAHAPVASTEDSVKDVAARSDARPSSAP